MAGNAVGQAVSFATAPSDFQINAGSFIGSGVAGAFGGTMGVGAAMARSAAWVSEGVLGRLAAGTPGVLGAVGISMENAPRAPSQCRCQ